MKLFGKVMIEEGAPDALVIEDAVKRGIEGAKKIMNGCVLVYARNKANFINKALFHEMGRTSFGDRRYKSGEEDVEKCG